MFECFIHLSFWPLAAPKPFQARMLDISSGTLKSLLPSKAAPKTQNLVSTLDCFHYKKEVAISSCQGRSYMSLSQDIEGDEVDIENVLREILPSIISFTQSHQSTF